MNQCTGRFVTNEQVLAFLASRTAEEQLVTRLTHGMYIDEYQNSLRGEPPRKIAVDFAACAHDAHIATVSVLELHTSTKMLDIAFLTSASTAAPGCINAIVDTLLDTFELAKIQVVTSRPAAKALRLDESRFELEASYPQALFVDGARVALEYHGLLC